MKLYVARHGQTVWNAANRVCGITDVELTEKGIEQGQELAKYEGVDRKNEEFLANKRNFAYRYPNGESMMQVAYRIYGLLEDIKEKYSGKDVLLISHGGVCRIVETYFNDMTNEEFFNYTLENAQLKIYEL